jgi:hypothetical protein
MAHTFKAINLWYFYFESAHLRKNKNTVARLSNPRVMRLEYAPSPKSVIGRRMTEPGRQSSRWFLEEKLCILHSIFAIAKI